MIVYPNPSANSFNIEFIDAKSGSYSLTLHSEDGKEVYLNLLNVNNPNYTYQLNTDEFPPGKYYLKIKNKEIEYTEVLVKIQ